MAEAPETGLDPTLPEGLLAELTEPRSTGIRREQVARARRHVADHRYEDGAVVEAVASHLLLLSQPG